jgi:hypothetical protein
MKRRILAPILVIALIIPTFLAAKPAYAFNPVCDIGSIFFPPAQATCAAQQAVQDFTKVAKEDLGRFISDLFTTVIEWGLNLLTGGIKSNIRGDSNSSSPQVAQNENNIGAISLVFMGMKTLFDNPPVTTNQYLASINPVSPTYAANCPNVPTDRVCVFGNTILNFWSAARNFAYLVFVIIIAIVGLMIMFRSKLDPRTSVTATAAIPGLIVALILITFSSAFATFMINIGQLLMEAIKNIMLNPILTQAPLLQTTQLPGCIANCSSTGISKSVGLTAGDIMQQYTGIFEFSGNHAFNLGGTAGGFAAALLLDLVVLVAMFILAIKVFFMLFQRYLYLLIKPLYAPFSFLFGALPGRSDTSIGWFRSYTVDVLTFPLVLFLLNLGAALMAGTDNIGAHGDPFGIINPGADLTALVALGILIICTKVPAFLEHSLNAVAPAHVEKAGADVGKLFQNTPIIGGFFKN